MLMARRSRRRVGLAFALLTLLLVVVSPPRRVFVACGRRGASTRLPQAPTLRSRALVPRRVSIDEISEILSLDDPDVNEQKAAKAKLKEAEALEFGHSADSYKIVIQAASKMGMLMALERWFTRASEAGVIIDSETYQKVMVAGIKGRSGFPFIDKWMNRAKVAKIFVDFGLLLQAGLTAGDKVLCVHLKKWEAKTERWPHYKDRMKEAEDKQLKALREKIERLKKQGTPQELWNLEGEIKKEAFGSMGGFDGRDFLSKEVRDGLTRDSPFNF